MNRISRTGTAVMSGRVIATPTRCFALLLGFPARVSNHRFSASCHTVSACNVDSNLGDHTFTSTVSRVSDPHTSTALRLSRARIPGKLLHLRWPVLSHA